MVLQLMSHAAPVLIEMYEGIGIAIVVVVTLPPCPVILQMKDIQHHSMHEMYKVSPLLEVTQELIGNLEVF